MFILWKQITLHSMLFLLYYILFFQFSFNVIVIFQLKFLQDNKNIFLRTAMKLYMSTSKRNRFNCVKELLSFQDNLKEIDSYPSEIHYLLARAYGLQNNNALALDHLRKARNEKVVDSKVI